MSDLSSNLSGAAQSTISMVSALDTEGIHYSAKLNPQKSEDSWLSHQMLKN